jgi:hypothetical protein
MNLAFNERVSITDWFERFEKGKEEKLELMQDFKLAEILSILEEVRARWSEKKYQTKFLRMMPRISGFSRETVEASLEMLQAMLSREVLQRRIELELGKNYLDDWISCDGHLVYASPIGSLLHVFAGNIFLNGIESLINGIITKNLNVVKTSSGDRFFPFLFVQSLAECSPELASTLSIVTFKGGNRRIEKKLKEDMDGIIVWGGKTSILSYRKDLPPGKKLIEHGPKCGVGIIYDYPRELPKLIARDIVSWEQKSCASLQILYVHRRIDSRRLAREIGMELDLYPPARLDPDHAVEILKTREVARMGEAFGDCRGILSADPNRWQIIFSDKFELSPLGRTLLVREFTDIEEIIQEIPREYLQTVALSSRKKKELGKRLVLHGASRIVDFGKMTEGMAGAPHEGDYPLRELLRFSSLENGS